MNRFLSLLLLGIVVAGTNPAARAFDGPIAYTLNLPFAANTATPAWLGQPVTGTNPFATLALPIVPPDSNAALLITVFFQEQNGGFLRISWQSGATPVPPEDGQTLPGPGEAALSSVLSENFYEGIGMNNQRSLLVPAEAMKQGGALVFQAGSATLGITRIQMQWLESAVGLNSPAIDDVLVTPADGHTEPASLLAGQPAEAQDPAWRGRIVDVPVTDVPLRIEQGLDFSVQIESVPTLARVALKENGLPWGQHLVVWVNSLRAGVVVPSTPPLGDDGYGVSATETYLGWRDGTLFLPSTQLQAGANTLQFTAEPDVPPAGGSDTPVTPLAVKDVLVQLAYPPSPISPAAAPDPSSSATSAATSTEASTTATAAATNAAAASAAPVETQAAVVPVAAAPAAASPSSTNSTPTTTP